MPDYVSSPYDTMSPEELARNLVRAASLDYDSALELVQFKDVSRGRDKAIEILEAHDRNQQRQDELTRSRARLRQAVY